MTDRFVIPPDFVQRNEQALVAVLRGEKPDG